MPKKKQELFHPDGKSVYQCYGCGYITFDPENIYDGESKRDGKRITLCEKCKVIQINQEMESDKKQIIKKINQEIELDQKQIIKKILNMEVKLLEPIIHMCDFCGYITCDKNEMKYIIGSIEGLRCEKCQLIKNADELRENQKLLKSILKIK